ncbi:TIGR02302 family protein [Pseudochrobactrum sp. sp1633]|uniref:TIGR02302 family protein n=1 Tax=Pseudochrobactrum sp. sp1633 TaxID=3036706 RepID=UPI0025A66954|nr:TIGR02302 family protein [Pseudochrobactrum sp. sp1633]MDM8345092.1 TIGR02302 family protein [Pseudochrobactrum sp. sp1633]HWD14925.1 TIGR02302 family protein [Pseudochrobactrum sp.]
MIPESETRPLGKTDSKLYRLRVKAALVLCFERLWPLVLPVLLLAALLLSLAWLGLFQAMPRWLHLMVIAGFALVFGYALIRFRHFRLPDDQTVNSRLERENGLQHSPLQLADDKLAGQSDDPLAQALWQEHRKRMAALTDRLHGFLPHPDIPQRDPHAFRAVVILLFASTAAYSFSPLSGKVSDLWNPPAGFAGPEGRVDAWITPPAYTGKAPVFLSANDAQDAKPVEIPQGSILSIQINGSTRNQLTLSDKDGQSQTVEAKPAPNTTKTQNSTNFELPLKKTVTAKLQAGSRQQTWQFNITPDTPPVAEFTRNPTYALNGTLELHYKVTDDYGAVKLQPDIKLLEKQSDDAQSLTGAPELRLTIPKRGKNSTDETTALQDLTMHPWAGKYVSLQLQVTDDAGQTGTSKEIRFVLPQRPFINPLARAVAEQRQVLALDSNQKTPVIQMLDALTMHPQTTIANISHYLGLRSVRERLKLARNDEDLREIVSYMWNVARGIEDGQLSDAEKALRAAQEALSQALQNNAGPEEIARLTQELREAMNRYLNEMARRQQTNPNKNAQNNPNTRVLSQRDIDRMMQQIEDLARSGNHAEAQQMLSQLQEMLNNLQPGQSAQQSQGQGQGQGQGNGAQQQLNKLGDLMRRQQELMNETFKLDQKLQEQTDDFSYDGEGEEQTNPQNGQSRQETEQALKDLQQQQRDLQNELNALTDQLKQQGLESSKEMDQAQNFMGRAGRSLGNGESGQATDQQAEALEALRRGARSMMQQMQQAQGQGEGQGQQNGEGRDPLGRETGQGTSEGTGNQLPNQIDIQKARRILDEIRKKLGDALSPQQEKDYLERLLQRDQ